MEEEGLSPHFLNICSYMHQVLCKCSLTSLFPSILRLTSLWQHSSGDVPRVNGQLAVSRAFGDKSLKSHLRSDPDIQHADVDHNTDLLILASDGLWKVSNLIQMPFSAHFFACALTSNIDINLIYFCPGVL